MGFIAAVFAAAVFACAFTPRFALATSEAMDGEESLAAVQKLANDAAVVEAGTSAMLDAQETRSSAEVSDDGVDYKWLYRKGDFLFYLDDYEKNEAHGPYTPEELYSVAAFGYYKGQWYDMLNYLERAVYNTNPNAYDNVGWVNEFYYDIDRTLFYTMGGGVRIDSVLCFDSDIMFRHDRNLCWFQGSIGNFNSEGVYPRMTSCSFYRQYGDKVSYDVDDIEIVDIHESVRGFWGVDPDSEEDSFWPSKATNLDRWFDGFTNLREVQGLECITACDAVNMAHMFRGCGLIEHIDISNFKTERCRDFTGMFEGCESLITLRTGEGWSQSGADGEGKKATFPHDMKCTRDGVEVLYREGEAIPDGAAEYETATRRNIKGAQVLLLDTARAGAAPTAPPITCEYTGSPVEPAVKASLDGSELVEGRDFTVAYANNVEDGEAKAVITGAGDYYGQLVVGFDIVDTGAYVFLYENGRMFLKRDHHAPSLQDVAASERLLLRQRWFDAASEAPGSTVPWAGYAGKVRSVTFYESFRTFEPTTARNWFAGCSSLTSVKGLEYVNGYKLTSLEGMFSGCSSLDGVEGLENLNGPNIVSIAGMFRDCSSIVNLDVGNLHVPNATEFDGFVSGCNSLQAITLGGIASLATADLGSLLEGADNLKTLTTTKHWRNSADKTFALKFPTRSVETKGDYRLYGAGEAVPAGAGEYRLRDLPLQFAYIVMSGPEFTSTGKPIKPGVRVMLGGEELKRGIDYTVSYKDNVYPGKASLTVKGKGTFTGGLVVPFTIVSRVTKVGDRLVYETGNVKYTLKVTKVKKKGGQVQSADAALVGVKVKNASLRTMSIPDTCTIAGIRVGVTEVSAKLVGQFGNVSCVYIGAKVVKIGPGAFAKAKSVRKLLVKSARLESVKNCLRSSNVRRVETRVYLSKKRKATYRTWFTKKSGKTGVKFVYGLYFAVV